MIPGEVLIYRDLFGEDHETVYIDTSPDSGNHYVIPIGRETGIWLRPAQLSPTGRMYKPEQEKQPEEKRKAWTWGDAVPDHAIKKRGGKKK